MKACDSPLEHSRSTAQPWRLIPVVFPGPSELPNGYQPRQPQPMFFFKDDYFDDRYAAWLKALPKEEKERKVEEAKMRNGKSG